LKSTRMKTRLLFSERSRIVRIGLRNLELRTLNLELELGNPEPGTPVLSSKF
jgi:hypothetical protein